MSSQEPLRQCVHCRTMRPRGEMVRIVRQTPEGSGIVISPGGYLPGRSAYVCRSPECLAPPRKQRRLDRALRCQVPGTVWEELEKRAQGPVSAARQEADGSS